MTPDDYNGISTQLEFPPGSKDGHELCVNITIANDLVLESFESFTVTLSNLVYAERATISLDTATVTIEDSTGYLLQI